MFVAVYGLLLAVLLFWLGGLINPWMTTWTARTTAWALKMLGANGKVEGTLVTSSLYTVKIIFECTAVFPCLIFLAAVAAYPSSWKQKLLGIGVGIPILLVFNLLRLLSLFYIGHWFPDYFEMAHLLVWQSLMLFFTVLLWLLWAVQLAHRHEA
jgi:exosortase H (IPTLxxWG-CTERM-specific)